MPGRQGRQRRPQTSGGTTLSFLSKEGNAYREEARERVDDNVAVGRTGRCQVVGHEELRDVPAKADL